VARPKMDKISIFSGSRLLLNNRLE
jgi:hypothetical protein